MRLVNGCTLTNDGIHKPLAFDPRSQIVDASGIARQKPQRALSKGKTEICKQRRGKPKSSGESPSEALGYTFFP